MAKSIPKEKITEAISKLELPDILSIYYQTTTLIEEKENRAKEKMADAEAELEMIRKGNGGKKE